jgi:hypothetical protein
MAEIELKNQSEREFIDISTEEWREYTYFNYLPLKREDCDGTQNILETRWS